MIESSYWKQELTRISRSLKPIKNPPRRTERSKNIAERDIIIGLFILRKLVESKKVTQGIIDIKIKIRELKAINNINILNSYDINENYDHDAAIEIYMPIAHLCNQMIHSCILLILTDDTRNFSDIYFVSDRYRNNLIYHIQISEIRSVFRLVARDKIRARHWKYNEEAGDYDVESS